MKRLTGHTDIGDSLLDEIAFINPDDAEGLYNLREIAQHGSDELLYEIANRLAEYEDTGLEPEKIAFLKNVVDDAFSDKPEFTEHVRELLRAEKDGRLVVLPCRVGDRIYRVVDDCTFPGDCGTKRMCKGCEYRNLFIEQTRFRLYLLTDDGKLRRGYYRTREEAEKALEEVCKENTKNT